MFIISMVARVFEPGCQCDYMPILEGPQGEEKSKALRILAGKWFSDNLPSNISSKDAKQHLAGKWLVEIPDFHIFRNSEIRALKAFQTMREDIFRPPYRKKEVYRNGRTSSPAPPTNRLISKIQPAAAVIGRSSPPRSTSPNLSRSATRSLPRLLHAIARANTGGPTKPSRRNTWHPNKKRGAGSTCGKSPSRITSKSAT